MTPENEILSAQQNLSVEQAQETQESGGGSAMSRCLSFEDIQTSSEEGWIAKTGASSNVPVLPASPQTINLSGGRGGQEELQLEWRVLEEDRANFERKREAFQKQMERVRTDLKKVWDAVANGQKAISRDRQEIFRQKEQAKAAEARLEQLWSDFERSTTQKQQDMEAFMAAERARVADADAATLEKSQDLEAEKDRLQIWQAQLKKTEEELAAERDVLTQSHTHLEEEGIGLNRSREAFLEEQVLVTQKMQVDLEQQWARQQEELRLAESALEKREATVWEQRRELLAKLAMAEEASKVQHQEINEADKDTLAAAQLALEAEKSACESTARRLEEEREEVLDTKKALAQEWQQLEDARRVLDVERAAFETRLGQQRSELDSAHQKLAAERTEFELVRADHAQQATEDSRKAADAEQQETRKALQKMQLDLQTQAQAQQDLLTAQNAASEAAAQRLAQQESEVKESKALLAREREELATERALVQAERKELSRIKEETDKERTVLLSAYSSTPKADREHEAKLRRLQFEMEAEWNRLEEEKAAVATEKATLDSLMNEEMQKAQELLKREREDMAKAKAQLAQSAEMMDHLDSARAQFDRDKAESEAVRSIFWASLVAERQGAERREEGDAERVSAVSRGNRGLERRESGAELPLQTPHAPQLEENEQTRAALWQSYTQEKDMLEKAKVDFERARLEHEQLRCAFWMSFSQQLEQHSAAGSPTKELENLHKQMTQEMQEVKQVCTIKIGPLNSHVFESENGKEEGHPSQTPLRLSALNSKHLEPTRKEQQPSKTHPAVAATIKKKVPAPTAPNISN